MKECMELECQIERVEDVAVVRCSGRMVRGAALERFEERMERLERVRMLVLDLGEVEMVDAGGLGTLVAVRGWAMENAARLKLVDPPAFLRRLLEVTRLSSVFEISSLTDALSILRPAQCAPEMAGAFAAIREGAMLYNARP